MSKAKKPHKMDQHLISNERHELAYWKSTYNISAHRMRAVKATLNTDSKDDILAYLIETGDIKVDADGKPVKRVK